MTSSCATSSSSPTSASGVPDSYRVGIRLETRALRLFGTAGRQAEESLEFLFHALDTWAGADVGDKFGQLFATNRADLARNPGRLLLFGTETGADLLDACCPILRHSAVPVHLWPHTSPVRGAPGPRQPLRGIPAAAKGAAQPDRGVGERAPSAAAPRARRRRAAHHRGRLTRGNQRLQQSAGRRRAGEVGLPEGTSRLGDSSVPARGPPFAPRLPAGVRPGRCHFCPPGSGLRITDGRAGRLARPHRRPARRRQLRARRNDRDLQFGSPSNGEPWRNLLTGTSRANLRPTANALGKVLDAVAAGTAPRESLRQMQDAFVRSREATGKFDWRYYLVRYDVMRQGASGIYASVAGHGLPRLHAR